MIYQILIALLGFYLLVFYASKPRPRKERNNWRILGAVILVSSIISIIHSNSSLNHLNDEINRLNEEKLNLESKILKDKEIIYSFNANLRVLISGNWKESPSNLKPAFFDPDMYYITIYSSSNPKKTINFYINRFYKVEYISKNQFEFKIEFSSANIDSVIGENFSVLKEYDLVAIFVPIIKDDIIISNEVTFDKIDLSFTLNNNIKQNIVVESKQNVKIVRPKEYRGLSWARAAIKTDVQNIHELFFEDIK